MNKAMKHSDYDFCNQRPCNEQMRQTLQLLERFSQSLPPAFRYSASLEMEMLTKSVNIQPAIVLYARELVKGTLPPPGKAELELLMLSMILRTSSTYGAIPALVADLMFSGLYSDAEILNENAHAEVGNRTQLSHAKMLFKDFEALARRFELTPLTATRYALARCMYSESAAAADEFRHILHANKQDMEAAKYYLAMADRRLFEYHATIESFVRHESHGYFAVFPRMLECALREADSVDEPQSNSFIGAWGSIFSLLMGDASESPWCRTHCRPNTDSSTSDRSSAEEDHAKDAREILSRLMSAVPPAEFIRCIRLARQLHEARLDFWNIAISNVCQIQSNSLAIQLMR